jgi:hypothetical protein
MAVKVEDDAKKIAESIEEEKLKVEIEKQAEEILEILEDPKKLEVEVVKHAIKCCLWFGKTQKIDLTSPTKLSASLKIESK